MSLTPQGFERPRLNELKAELDRLFIEALGPVNTNADSVTGQIIGIFSAALDDAYEALQNTYDSMYPFSAEGTSLDGAVSFVGLERLAAAPTNVNAICYGVEGMLVPQGALTRALDNRQYACSTDTVISRSNAADVHITVVTVTNLANYQIIAGGVSVVYTADASATAAEIAAGLAALFDTNNFIATATDGVLHLTSVDQQSGFTLTVDSKLSITELGTPVPFVALLMGAYALPANSLTTMDTTIDGWNSVNNLVAGNVGRFVESDDELRSRHSDAVHVIGAATAPSIRSRILAEVDGVTYVRVYENRTNATDAFSLPPHSFETVVEGGIDQEIGNRLFELKPAGIETYGNTSVLVVDDNGDSWTCKFSRASDKYAWIRVSVNIINTEEPLTTQLEQAIKDAVLAFGDSLDIGGDIIPQRFYGPIYQNTTGLGSITVEAAITNLPTDTPSYTTNNVSVARTEHAVFDILRVTVVGI